MNKTKIPWCDYTVNPVKGLCPMACSYCYARRMYKRFKWNPEIRFDFGAMDLFEAKPASRFFVGSTMELFGDWVGKEWLDKIFRVCADWSGHTFIFLTKQPQNLIRWSPFPDNCWVGASVTDSLSYEKALKGLSYVSTNVRFLSIEPFLSYFNVLGRDFDIFHWIILGCQTPVSEKTLPKREWVEEIINAADKASIPVFVKPPLSDIMNLHREEFPKP